MGIVAIVLGLLILQDAPKLSFKKGDAHTYALKFSTGYETKCTQRMYETSIDATVRVQVEKSAADEVAVTVTIEKLKAEFFDENGQNENTPDAAWSSDDRKWVLRSGMLEDGSWPALVGSTLQPSLSAEGKVIRAAGLDGSDVQTLMKTILGDSTFLNLKAGKGGTVTVSPSSLETQLKSRWRSGRGPEPLTIPYGADGKVTAQKRTIHGIWDEGGPEDDEFAFAGKVSSDVRDGVLQSSSVDIYATSQDVGIYWRVEIKRQ